MPVKKINIIMISILLVVIVFLFIALSATIFYSEKNSEYKTGKVTINNNSFDVEIADNFIKQTLGLSGRESLNKDSGMFFIFSQKSTRSFWMKDMNFPIDIIWMDDDTIIHITKNLQPPKIAGKILTAISSKPSNKVLEINAGLSEKLGIKIGDKISLEINGSE